MRFSKDFLNITAADFIVRSAYQMGKTPLLPIFAAMLGADDLFLGIIVSVSTISGLLLKPLFGILSDRWGRMIWLIIGTAFFVGMPFLYQFVYAPEQLFIIRLIHGLATAIYGPVTLAYIAELKPGNLAESLGWFGIARSGGYIAGPALAGWMLLSMEPGTVFTIIGLISCLAIIPVLRLKEVKEQHKRFHPSLRKQIIKSFGIVLRTPAIWLSGALESGTFISLYTLKTFLPIYALDIGISIALVGLFFSVQEAAHILVKPFGGRMADRVGYPQAIGIGLLILSSGLFLVPLLDGFELLFPAMITGIAQALIFPSTIALVSEQITYENLGAGMGFIGTIQNMGKVIGPILGGLLIREFGFEAVLWLMALLILFGVSITPLIVVGRSNRQLAHGT